jgi:hypothetical protein
LNRNDTPSRLTVILSTVFALGAPLMLCLFGYLALSDGFVWSEGDPLREGRLFMMRDNRRLVGLGLVTKSSANPADATVSTQVCARTHFTGLQWSPRWAFEQNSDACSCYVDNAGRLREVKSGCAAAITTDARNARSGITLP